MRTAAVVLALVLAGAAGAARAAAADPASTDRPATADPTPIPEARTPGDFPAFLGAPARARPLTPFLPPRHPRMAPDGSSNLHVDAYQTDVNLWPGPLGRDPSRRSTFRAAECASVTFDSRGRIVTACVGLHGVTLELMDPVTLDTLASFPLPARTPSAGTFQDFSGGGYFYLDDRDRAVVPTTTRHLWVVAQRPGPAFARERDIDLTRFVREGDGIISALPDWDGRVWFASRRGVVGAVDLESGSVRARDLGEPVGNSFAVDRTGAVFIVTDAALYRFEADAAGRPRVVWRQPYANDGRRKPGQTQTGSGTTPTLIGHDRVAITDNADPINVVVLDRRRRARGARLRCRVPVFERGASATDQSLIATPDLVIAENNHGYTGPTAVENGRSTSPGLTRVDLHPSGRGCRVAWTSLERAPSVVPKLSAATGLVYTYTKDQREDREDPWYLTALDVRTGRTVWKALAGDGLGYNNHYAPVTLGRDGTAYVGALGGLVALRDAVPPRARPPAPGRARLRVGCARERVRVRVTGRRIRRVVVRAGKQRAVDERPPFDLRLRARAGTPIVARVRLEGGYVRTRRGRAPDCRARA